MKLYEIEGWSEGVKVRRKSWHDPTSWNEYCQKSFSSVTVDNLLADDWELYDEPKRKKVVTLWKPIMKSGGRYLSSIQWSSDKSGWDRDKDIIVAWESREVEVEE